MDIKTHFEVVLPFSLEESANEAAQRIITDTGYNGVFVREVAE